MFPHQRTLLWLSGHRVCGGRRELHRVPEPGGLHQGNAVLQYFDWFNHDNITTTQLCVCSPNRAGRSFTAAVSSSTRLSSSSRWNQVAPFHNKTLPAHWPTHTGKKNNMFFSLCAALTAGPEVMDTNLMTTPPPSYWTEWIPCTWLWFRLHSTNKSPVVDSSLRHSFFVLPVMK